MRFVVVYQDFRRQATDLIERLGVEDVRVLVMRKGERKPGPEFLEALEGHPNAPAALCQVVRKFAKSIQHLVDVQYSAKRFREEDQQLAEWLRPADTAPETFAPPSEVLREAVRTTTGLIASNRASDRADALAEHRWKFATQAVGLLRRYCLGEDLGPFRNWKETHGVEFAANGRVRYDYTVTYRDEVVRNTTEWHLKEGDRTTPEAAARIYFERVELAGEVKLLIFYLGPHPDDGTYSVRIECGVE